MKKSRVLNRLKVRAFKMYRQWGWSHDGKNNLSVKDPTYGGTVKVEENGQHQN